MEKLYTISEVADKLGLSSKTLRRWEESGKFTGSRTLGGQRRYSLTDLQILDAIKHGTIPSSQDLLTIDQAAALFGVGPATIVRWENEGKIHPLITAGVTYYPRHRLLEKLSELKQAVQEETNPVELTPPPAVVPLAPPPAPPFRPAVSLPRNFSLPSLALNFLMSLLLLFFYHFLFNRPTPVPASPGAGGQVQGSSTTRDPSLTALDSLLDKSGNLKSRSLTTGSLSLSPAAPPADVPGTLYFDAGSQSLKLYTTGWQDFPGPANLQIKDNTLLSGIGTIPQGKNSLKVDLPAVRPETPVQVTFRSDFAPAKKHWVTVGNGSFTVQTDFPVAASSDFTYLIFIPNEL